MGLGRGLGRIDTGHRDGGFGRGLGRYLGRHRGRGFCNHGVEGIFVAYATGQVTHLASGTDRRRAWITGVDHGDFLVMCACLVTAAVEPGLHGRLLERVRSDPARAALALGYRRHRGLPLPTCWGGGLALEAPRGLIQFAYFVVHTERRVGRRAAQAVPRDLVRVREGLVFARGRRGDAAAAGREADLVEGAILSGTLYAHWADAGHIQLGVKGAIVRNGNRNGKEQKYNRPHFVYLPFTYLYTMFECKRLRGGIYKNSTLGQK